MFSLWRGCFTVRGPRLGSASLSHRALSSLRVFAFRRMSQMGVRRAKAALSSGCKAHPAIRSSRKQSEQSWR
jgi:hypothetical protein